jgi:protein tyrosine/serine phosphatase
MMGYRHRAVAIALLTILASPVWMAAQNAKPAGVERFHRVDDRLFRGAQPTQAGLKSLWDTGVRTVISLRDDNDIGYDERKVAESLGMKWINIPIQDGSFFAQSRRIPDDAIRAFFDAVDSAGPGPIFVHCRRGTDRTGAIVAFYRIARQEWPSEKAAKEARDVGMRPWYRGLEQQIKEFTPPTTARTTGQ